MKVTSFNVKGERCSGTNYIYKLIETNLELPWAPSTGWKHGYCNPIVLPKLEPESFLTVVIFRNVYDWVRSFYLRPWHLPRTVGGVWIEERKLTFSQFIRTDEIKGIDAKALGDPEIDLFIDRHPFYLRNPKNVLELRKWKIEYYLNLPNILPNVYYVNYEDLIQNPKKIIDEINERWVGKDYEFKNWDKYKIHTNIPYVPKTYFDISEKDKNFIIKNTDWKLEEKIGYFK